MAEMKWARSARPSLNARELLWRKKYTWHLLSDGAARCQSNVPVSDVVADRPPEGELHRVCLNCNLIAVNEKLDSAGHA